LSGRGFWKAGHSPTLVAAFLYFDVSFMVWVLLGPLGPFIGEALKLSATERGFMTALPLLGGSLFRPILGMLADRIGGRKTGMLGMALTLFPLLLGWQFASRLEHLFALGFLLGIAGASFAVALPLAGGWYPPEYQGLAMGIAGAGNSGTLLATLFAPRLAQAYGWEAVLGLAAIPVCAVWLLFSVMAKDSPKTRPVARLSDYASVLRDPDTRWFCFLYSLTFGTFVGLASFLTGFFHDQYGLSRVRAGDFTTAVVLAGSFLRPVGGMLSDKIGGYKLLLVLLMAIGCCLGFIGLQPTLPLALLLLILATAMLGMGNGAVFQLVPQRFPESVGLVTGIVGAAGGIGGFLLPSLLGVIKDQTGQYSLGFLFFALAFFTGAVSLLRLGSSWSKSWRPASVERAGIFCYRTWKKGLSEAA
jgi:MFS transporter, NNP family, nitrate/nitrite transporter